MENRDKNGHGELIVAIMGSLLMMFALVAISREFYDVDFYHFLFFAGLAIALIGIFSQSDNI